MKNESEPKQEDAKKGDSISIADAIRLQDNLAKDVDFSKPDSELAPEELVKKFMYQALDESVEKSLGTDKKKTIDDARKKMNKLDVLAESLRTLGELGKEVEKNLLFQYAFLGNHFDKKSEENHYHKAVSSATTAVIDSKASFTNEERVDRATKILDLIEKYRGLVLKELKTKQELVSALIKPLESALAEIDLDALDDTDSTSRDITKNVEDGKEWLDLTKQVLGFREKGIKAVEQDLEMDEILPRYVVDNDGDISKTISPLELGTKGERMIRLTNEASQEEKISARRSQLSERLFGKAETYIGSTENKEEAAQLSRSTPTSPANGIYSISKGQFITLWIFAAIGWLWALSDADSYDPSPWSGLLTWVIPLGIIFYTIGWRNARKH